MDLRLHQLVQEASRRYAAMSLEQRKAHDDAQRASWVRGMTARCEHGVADFEQCGKCRATKEKGDRHDG